MLDKQHDQAHAELQTLRHKLWLIACHATGGGIPKIDGIDRSINDICVQISAHNNAIWKHAQEAALRDAALEASSRQEERLREMRDVLESAIRALDADSTPIVRRLARIQIRNALKGCS